MTNGIDIPNVAHDYMLGKIRYRERIQFGNKKMEVERSLTERQSRVRYNLLNKLVVLVSQKIILFYKLYFLLQGRVVVAHVAHNHEVGGAIPSPATNKNLCRYRQAVKSSPFHGEVTGSSPVACAIYDGTIA